MRNVTPEQVAMAEQHRRGELPDRIEGALGELAGAAKEGLMALSVGVGLGVLHELMAAEVDLDLPEGGVAGFVGPNGAGKSTTIRMLLGLITPTGGEGEVFGHPIGRPAAYLHRVGALIEAPAFYPALTGEANLTAEGCE
jgi:ABC-2 type transport system ATP-binding protein